MKIRFVKGDDSGCGYYRCELPAKYLRSKGHIVECDTKIKWSEITDPQSDIYIFQRVMRSEIVVVMNELVKRRVVVADNDDNFKMLPDSNPAKNVHHPSRYEITRFRTPGEIRHELSDDLFVIIANNDGFLNPQGQKKFERIVHKRTFDNLLAGGIIKIYKSAEDIPHMRSSDIGYLMERKNDIKNLHLTLGIADAVTFTTPHMKETHPENKNTFVLPNYIDFNKYQRVKKVKNDKVTVGWAGSITHSADISTISGWFDVLAQSYPESRWLFCNDKAVYDKYLDKVPEKQKAFLPGVPIDDYPKLIANLDIGLVPLEDTQFNQSKSWIKGLEYSALGIPFVASPTESYEAFYNDTYTANKGFFLAKKGKHWKKYISMLLEDNGLRKKMSQDCLLHASYYDIMSQGSQWEDLYESLIEQFKTQKAW